MATKVSATKGTKATKKSFVLFVPFVANALMDFVASV